MMGILTTVSLIGSLALWAGYQAFFVPGNSTKPLAGQNLYVDPHSGRHIPQKFLHRPAHYGSSKGSFQQKFSDDHAFLGTIVVPYASLSRHMLSSSVENEHMENRFISEPSISQLNVGRNSERELSSPIYNPHFRPTKTFPHFDKKPYAATDTDISSTNSLQTPFDDVHKHPTFQNLLTSITEDNPVLQNDITKKVHYPLENQDIETVSSSTGKIAVNEIAYTETPISKTNTNSLSILYTLVNFVKNLEIEERGNFSKVLDNLVPVHITRGQDGHRMTLSNRAPQLVPTTQPRYIHGTVRFPAQEAAERDKDTLQDTTDKGQDVAQNGLARHKNIPVPGNADSRKLTKGLFVIEEDFEVPNLKHGMSPADMSPSERMESEKAKMLSKEYMLNFGWQGYLLIFFIIVIVLLLLTTMILFTSSYFTWRRNKRKQQKSSKASSSQKEA